MSKAYDPKRRWDIKELKPKEDRPLVNTSLPAQNAPKLVPTTLAEATRASAAEPQAPKATYSASYATSQATYSASQTTYSASQAGHASHASNADSRPPSRLQKHRVAVSSLDEFPTLGKPKANANAQANAQANAPAAATWGAPRFAELSKQWAAKQQEDEAKAKEERDKEARLRASLQQEREKEEMVLRRSGLVGIPGGLFNQKKTDSDEEKFKDESNSDVPYSSDEPTEEEEEEDEEEYDEGWNGRKHRDDIY